MIIPKISVITPSYNQGEFIEETILSIINQDYPKLEYIIIDGGSNDKTIDIIKKYENRVTYWISEKDNGQSEAINKGFKKATGDIICWINSDDILLPGALKKVMSYFQANENVDVLNGYTVVIDEKSNILFNLFMLQQKKWYAKHGIYYIAQPSLFWRRRLFDSVGLLRDDIHFIMDQEFLIRIFERNLQIGHLEKILAGFRRHGTSKTYMSNSGKIGTKERVQKAHDLFIVRELHGQDYVQNAKPMFRWIYRFEKFFRGLYFRSFFFMLKWKGKNVNELRFGRSHYL